MHRSVVRCALPTLAVLALATASTRAHAGDAKRLLDLTGVDVGLCVHLGAGSASDPGLSADLAAGGRLLVHAVALDDASLERARQTAESKGVLGRVIVEKLPLDPLPHLRDLANVVVIEDRDALAAKGLKFEEVERIVRPGGVICTKKGGAWSKSIKAWSKEMDEWTHTAHGPDGSMVSADRLVQFPVGLRWLDGVPMNFNLWAACRGWVIGGGRCFTLSTTEPENLGSAHFIKPKNDEYLTARDAFNGLPLWKVNCGTSNEGKALNAHNKAALVTDGRRVFVYQKDKIVALDAATGQTQKTYPAKYPSVRMLLVDGVLISAGWEAKEESKDGERPELWSHFVSKTSVGAVEAFDVEKGTLKWSVATSALDVVAADGVVYLLLQSGNPVTKQEVVAVELASGQTRWRMPHTKLSPESPLFLGCAGPGAVVVSRSKAKAITILSAVDGKVLWEISPTGHFWTPLVDGLLWHGNKKYDLKSGEVKGTLPLGIDSPVCTPSAIVGNYVTASRGGDYFEICSLDGSQTKVNRIHYGATRGACIEGTTPAYGMFYTGQNNCRCSPGQVPGFVAFGPNGELPKEADFAQERTIETGPAFGAAGPTQSSADDWPMYRHDAERSGLSTVKLPEKLKTLWQADATKPAEGPLTEAWKARFAGVLTQPVIAEGKVFAAAVEAGQIVAFDAVSGKPAWRATAGGRIDTPPTIYRGLCLFGCHDGWVYALRTADGKLAWRVRVAPWERRLVAFGQVESVWPAIGSVVVLDNVLYASAGRTTESDGGLALCALDPASGKQRWALAVGPGPARQNDVLTLRDGRLAVHHVSIDPKTGKYEVVKQSPHTGLEGLIDGSWKRLGFRRSGRQTIGRATGEFLLGRDTIYGYDGGGRNYFAVPRVKTVLPEKPDQKDYNLAGDAFAWRQGLPANHQVEAIAVGENVLVLGGRICNPASDKSPGFLFVVSLQDGKRTAEYPLDSPPSFDGLSVAHGRVYVALENGKLACFDKAE